MSTKNRTRANRMLSREARLEDMELVAQLLDERDSLVARVAELEALVARNHVAYLRAQGIDA